MMLRSRSVINKTEVAVRGGIVATQHPLASVAGARMLQRGGNAIDAAVAAALAVGVVEPMMSGIGGGGAMVVHDPATGRDVAIDFLPRVPGAATPDMYELDQSRANVGMYEWPAVVGDANFVGHRSVGVPGAVAGLCLAHSRWGKLPLATVFEPAIEYAHGHVVEGYISAITAGMAHRLRQFAEAARVFLPGGLPPAAPLRMYMPVEPFRQPDLARTLERIAANGPEEFYHGETARLIVEDMELHGGLITAADLASYRPVVHEETRKAEYRGVTVSALPTPCGANTVIETLNILENFDVAGIGRDSVEGLALMAQAQALAFQDRFAYLADPAHHAIPDEILMSREYAAERARHIRLDRRPDEIGPGDPGAFTRDPAGTPPDQSCTTHLSVVDKDGMMVSLTNTVGDVWGSFVVARDTGILLNDGMIWFDPVPGRINSVAPGKMPLSAMAGVLVHRNGRPWIGIGAPGARKVMTAVLQSIVNVVDHGMSLQDAIAAPRIHCEKDRILADDRLPDDRLQVLDDMGYPVLRLEENFMNSNFARPVGVLLGEDGVARSGVDVFRPASAVGVPADQTGQQGERG